MASILAFAGSNSSVSINYKLVQFTASLLNKDVRLINLANYPLPMYSYDEELKNGFKNSLNEFNQDIKKAKGIILSVNEHNSNPSAFFKNTLDWLSRVDKNFLSDTKVFLMATSPGRRGAINSMEVVEKLLPRFGAEIVVTFSLPSFGENFDANKGIINSELAKKHQDALNLFISKL